MRYLLTALLGCLLCADIEAQGNVTVVDSFKVALKEATTTERKVYLLGTLSKVLMNIDLAEADRYAKEMTELAEMSRNRRLIVQALIVNGERFSYLSGRRDNIAKSMAYYNQALETAKQNKLDTLTAYVYLGLADLNTYVPDLKKSLDHCNEANSIATTIKDDSLNARVHFSYGNIYLLRNEKIPSLRHTLNGLRIAEEMKNEPLQRAGLSRLGTFYTSVEDYEKAIDYTLKVISLIPHTLSGQLPYQKIGEYNKVGKLYSLKKNFDMAMVYYNKALALADTLKFGPIKAMVYQSIINDYVMADQPQKAMDYFNQHPEMKEFLRAVNFTYLIDQSYGLLHSRLGNYDSALYYYDRAAPNFERDVNQASKYAFYYQVGLIHKNTGKNDLALSYFLKARAVAEEINGLNELNFVTEQLDTLSRTMGDYKSALMYAQLHFGYKDSLNKLNEEKDLMQLEIADEQQRQARLEGERVEKKRKRDNIQYLAITIGITALFVAMVMMGMFKVSAATIKVIGFFAFLMFFEFIFLIFKKNIYTVTNGEPWKDLMFMIGLAAILLPLHHWVEHRVIHYLTSHNRLTASGSTFREKFFGRKKRQNAGKDA